MSTGIGRRRFAGAAAAVVLGAVLGIPTSLLGMRPAAAHEGKCPLCKLDVVQDTEKLDHEVALKSGRKRIEYRCVYCALADAKSYAGDITLLAPSELKGKPVLLTRTAGKWTVAPESAVFVGHKVNHRSCQLGYRALTTPDAFPKWVQAQGELLKDAKPQTLAELLEIASPAK